MRIEKIIIDCMQTLHNIYFINEMSDCQTQEEKEEQNIIYEEYTLLRDMLAFYTGIPYKTKSYADRLDIMYFEKGNIIEELKSK